MLHTPDEIILRAHVPLTLASRATYQTKLPKNEPGCQSEGVGVSDVLYL